MFSALHVEFERKFGDVLTLNDILTNSLKHSLMLTVSHSYFKDGSQTVVARKLLGIVLSQCNFLCVK
jgi:hypothetical protein